jgi:hypothetical protein
MPRDAFAKVAALVFLLAALSIKTIIEDYQQHERSRLFGFLDAIIRCAEVIKSHPIDRDTTIHSNETIASITNFKYSVDLRNNDLLLALREYVGDSPIVTGRYSLLEENRSPLDPDASITINSFNLTGTSPVPTRMWTSQSGSGYGSAMVPASRLILLISAKAAATIFFTAEPILFVQSSQGSVFALSIPVALRPFLRYWSVRPADMPSFLDDKDFPKELQLKGQKLKQLGVSHIIELMTFDQLQAETIRLAAIQNGKGYALNEIHEALKDSLRTERAKIELFGISFSRDFFAVVLPSAYIFAGFSLFWSYRRTSIKKSTFAPKNTFELGMYCLAFLATALTVVPIGWATIRHLAFVTSTGLPEQPSQLKHILTLAALCLGFGLLAYPLLRESRRMASRLMARC